jgi:hypothetical protein
MQSNSVWPSQTLHLPWAEPVESDEAPFYEPGHVGLPWLTVFVTRKLMGELETNAASRESMILDLRQFMRIWSARSPILN